MKLKISLQMYFIVHQEMKINKIENKKVEEYKFARPLSEVKLRKLRGFITHCIGGRTFVTKK